MVKEYWTRRATSYDDVFDAFRLAMKFYRFDNL